MYYHKSRADQQRYFSLRTDGSIGTPKCTDNTTNKPQFDRTFGHFVRMLVDM